MGNLKTDPYVHTKDNKVRPTVFDKHGWRIKIEMGSNLNDYTVEEWAEIIQDTANHLLDEIERQQSKPSTPRLKLT